MANSKILITLSVPVIRKLPSEYSISAEDVSKMCPASLRPFSMPESIVTDNAQHAKTAEREATEANPVAGVFSLFPSMMRTFSNGTSSNSDTTWAKEV